MSSFWANLNSDIRNSSDAARQQIIARAYGQSYSQARSSENGILPGYFNGDGQFDLPDPIRNLKLAMNDGTYDKEHLQAWKDFDRFYAIDLVNEVPSSRHYIFICRPDLYLVEDGNKNLSLSAESRVAYDPYFNYLAEFHPQIVGSLTGDFAGITSLRKTDQAEATASGYGNSQNTDGTAVNIGGGNRTLTVHAFIPYLTSRIESLQLPDYTIKQNYVVQPYTKYSIPYSTSAIESSTGGTFDITFREDRYYSIHKLFYGWVYYMNGVMRNIFHPKEKYLLYNAIDYATSIYDFIVDETGENVLYWTKYTGAIPTNVPMSDLSFNRNGSAETNVTISFSYFYCEHMNREILMDFNYNSMGYIAMNTYAPNNKLNPVSLDQTTPIYNSDNFLGKNFVGRPVILYMKDRGKPCIKLRWLP